MSALDKREDRVADERSAMKRDDAGVSEGRWLQPLFGRRGILEHAPHPAQMPDHPPHRADRQLVCSAR
jgi:hypothetical protein